MRKVKEGNVDKGIMERIAYLYGKLKVACGYKKTGNYCSKSYEDIFQDTVLYVSQDKEARDIQDEKGFIKHFRYRFNMIEYQAIQDNKTERKEEYADYKKEKEMEQEG